MLTISGTNVNSILPLALHTVYHNGFTQDSRNGPVKRIDGPATICYEKPKERVLFYEERDANPFFHFMESLWMLGGRNDVDWIGQFNSTFAQFSDDGVTFHGAYGYRWRKWFDVDQIGQIIEILKNNPDDRRCVLQMWDASHDLGFQGKDFPCNLLICFAVSVDGHLDMTVYNRSNDLIWGALGANAVHMSVLQEYVAAGIGIPVGRYWQVANNLHLYTAHLDKYPALMELVEDDPYAQNIVRPYPMVNTDLETWDSELQMFLEEGPVLGFTDPFFKKVAIPIYNAWFAYKDKQNPERFNKALGHLKDCKATDWAVACSEWLIRRANK